MLVNTEELIMALESRDGEIEWYLDLQSGAAVPLVEGLIDDGPSLAEALEADPDRFLHIDPISSGESFRVMEAFVASLPPGDPATRLAAALGQRHPFHRFKDTLFEWPHVREQWFRFHDARMREVAQDWLTVHDLQAKLTDR